MARAAWREEWADRDPAGVVFLDETSTPTTLTPTRARAPRDERAVGRVPRGRVPRGRVPRGRWEAVTLLAALTPAGMGPSLVLPGALDRDAFEAYVERVLVPILRPGQTVVLDNLSVHKRARARQLVEAAGCALRFLPTSSPDLNPIEPAFAKLKGRLRRAEARTFGAVADALSAAYPAVTAADCRGFYRDAGYNL